MLAARATTVQTANLQRKTSTLAVPTCLLPQGTLPKGARPFAPACPSCSGLLASRPARSSLPVTRANTNDEKTVVYNKEFGYSRKDVILIGVGLIAFGYALYYGLQATGMEPGYAGNWVQLIIFVGICIGWVSTYLYRVATKQMTYVKQLEQYEDAVMRKRLDEMTDAEAAQLLEDVEAEKLRRQARQQQQQQQ